MKMKISCRAAACVAGFVVFSSLFAQVAQAAAQVYTFTASNFTAYNGLPVPYATVSGQLTLDGTTITDINLAIGDHTYLPSEVGYFLLDTAGSSVIGSYKGSPWDEVRALSTNTNDFMLGSYIFQNSNFIYFTYSVASLNDFFESTNVALSISAVPEPNVYAMLASGLGIVAVAVRRKRRE